VSSYRGTADRPDQAKAIAAVVAVHVALAFIILSGLNVRMVQRAVERLTTIDITEPPPPPPVQPPPQPAPQPHAMKEAQGAPAKKAEPSPVVAPPPKLPVPSPIPAAKVAGTGSAPTSGAALAGNGTGAGGIGTGPGGGGNDFSGYTPARRISRIPDREYGALAATGLRSGNVGVTIRVNPDGSVSNCRIARSSGNSYADSLMCQLTVRYIRFDPARDPNGRPVAQDITFFPNWWKP
jgi:periplasmic protein TonB